MNEETIMTKRIKDLKEKFERGVSIYLNSTPQDRARQGEINRATDLELINLLKQQGK